MRQNWLMSPLVLIVFVSSDVMGQDGRQVAPQKHREMLRSLATRPVLCFYYFIDYEWFMINHLRQMAQAIYHKLLIFRSLCDMMDFRME